jgi:gamma-glutamyl:cysteine ligase YbdK (ATP-grasp superfamily)
MKKTIDTKPELVPQTVALVPEVQEQMKEIMKKLKEVQPVFQQLNSSLELVIRTAIGQAGFTMAEVKNLSLDEENWVLKFEK